ncbi:Non-specific phospholipase C6 [Batrachochytrium dendrobatidis]|nr:Non-specific phospholipase C6 [Batrachochytrium dendrobatidis]
MSKFNILLQRIAVYHSDDTSRFFEHSSIPATLKKLFNLPNFLTPRDAAALTFDDVISLSEPRTDCIQTLPTV